jgi:hypothetical protein
VSKDRSPIFRTRSFVDVVFGVTKNETVWLGVRNTPFEFVVAVNVTDVEELANIGVELMVAENVTDVFPEAKKGVELDVEVNVVVVPTVENTICIAAIYSLFYAPEPDPLLTDVDPVVL